MMDLEVIRKRITLCLDLDPAASTIDVVLDAVKLADELSTLREDFETVERGFCDMNDAAVKTEKENERLQKALKEIKKTPLMPFPDSGAHSLRVYADAVFTAWSRIQQIAREALKAETQ